MTIKTQAFAVSGNFVVPSGITAIRVTLIGGGGGGGDAQVSGTNFDGGGGGGRGELVQKFSMNVTPGQIIPVTIGAGGLGGSGATIYKSYGQPGGTSQFGFITAAGGYGGADHQHQGPNTGASVGGGGNGGGPRGGVGGRSTVQADKNGFSGLEEATTYYGGGGGGCQGLSGIAIGGAGNGAPGLLPANGGGFNGSGGGGGGGAYSPWGPGGTGGTSGGHGQGYDAPSTSYGAGGGGGAKLFIGGTGANGYCLIEWMG